MSRVHAEAAPSIEWMRERLRPEPPGFLGSRADLKGDHAVDLGRWEAEPETAPRLAAVLVPVVLHRTGPSILLTQRSAALRSHAGQIAFPGGRIDPEDASPIDAALREAEEEIGLDRRHVRPLGYLDAYLTRTDFFVLPVVAGVAPAFRLQLNPREVETAFEVPLSFLMDEANHELHAREWEGGIRQYYAMPFEGRFIWGVTAGILRNMFERLYAA